MSIQWAFQLKFRSFQRLKKTIRPSLLERKDRQPAVTLTADALGRPSGTVADEVVAYVKIILYLLALK